ncbi:MAG TPA: TM2 domain-containing protein [Burkholderiaceae bacterium]|nr:TM2 domain-containing protein [Burkholderiaceae bacterium]
MLQKIVLAVAVFLIILVALTFGEGVAQQLFAWISHLTGLIIYNFSDVYHAIREYMITHATKVVIALVLTAPITYWILHTQAEELKQPNTNRKIAIVLAIFLGWLGAHRFYLGQIGWGLVFLIVLWFFPPVAVLAGLVDAIRYLFMKDSEFPQAEF